MMVEVGCWIWGWVYRAGQGQGSLREPGTRNQDQSSHGPDDLEHHDTTPGGQIPCGVDKKLENPVASQSPSSSTVPGTCRCQTLV